MWLATIAPLRGIAAVLRRSPALRFVLVLLIASSLLVGMPTDGRAATDWTPGPSASDQPLQGFVDSPEDGSAIPISSPLVVMGWVADPLAASGAGIDEVLIYEGLMGSGGFRLSYAYFGLPSDDVAEATERPEWASAGYRASLMPGMLRAEEQTINVYAHSPEHGWWYQQVTVTGLLAEPLPPINYQPVAPTSVPQVGSSGGSSSGGSGGGSSGGCGSRGGPGYRLPSGKCAGWGD